MKEIVDKQIKNIAYNSILLIALSYFIFPYYPDKLSIDFFGNIFSITQILMIFSLMAVFVYLWREFQNGSLKISRELMYLFASLLAFLFVAGVSTFLAVKDPIFLFPKILSLVSVFIIVFLFSILPIKKINSFLFMTAGVAIISALLGILQFYFLGDLGSPAHWLGGRNSHMFATGFGNFSSFFGTSMAVFVSLFWGLALSNYLKRRRVWLIATVFSAVGLLLSFSRSAILAGAAISIVMLIFFWMRGVDRKFILKSIALIGFVCIFAINFNPPLSIRADTLPENKTPKLILKERFDFIGEIFSFNNPPEELILDENNVTFLRFDYLSDYSAYSRVAFHKAGLIMLTSNPVNLFIGLGVDGFKDNLNLLDLEKLGLGKRQTNAHSFFLETLITGGILGFVLMVLFLVLLFVRLLNIRKLDNLAMPILFSLTAILFDGLFHTHLFVKYLWILVGLAIAIMWKLDSTKDSIREKI